VHKGVKYGKTTKPSKITRDGRIHPKMQEKELNKGILSRGATAWKTSSGTSSRSRTYR